MNGYNSLGSSAASSNFVNGTLTTIGLTSPGSNLTPTFTGQVTSPNNGTISGLTVTIYTDKPTANTVLGTAITNSEGIWVYTHNTNLLEGIAYTFHARITLTLRSDTVTQTFTTVPSPPVNTTMPVISGAPTVSQLITVNNGNWTGTQPITYTYQWRRDGVAIVNATANNYTLNAVDVGINISCAVTSTNSVGTATAVTAPIGPIADDFPATSSVFVRYEPAFGSNVFDQLNQAFSPTDVDIANNRLNLSGLNFATFTSYAAASGTPVFFESTGVLPAPLQPNTAYYIEPGSNGGTVIYPEASPTDHVNRAGALPPSMENIYPADNYAQQANRIMLTTTGTGTHRMFSRPLISRLSNMVAGKNYYTQSPGTNNRHTYMETATDGSGKPYIISRKITRHNINGNYNIYGKLHNMGPSMEFANVRNEFAGKRTVWQLFVGKVYNTAQLFKSVVKISGTPSAVSSITGVVNLTSHRLNTGDLMNVMAYPGGAIPTGYSGDTFARRIDANNFTLHPTLTDATNNTAVIIPSSQGTVGFTFFCPERVGDSIRWGFPIEVREVNAGGNSLSPRTEQGPVLGVDGIYPIVNKVTIGFVHTGANNGDYLGYYDGLSTPTYPDITKVRVWLPPRAVGPTRQDTGLPLNEGTYWVTKRPGSNNAVRFHATYASAAESVGVANASSSCLKFTAGGSGEMYCICNDDTVGMALGRSSTNMTEVFESRIPQGKLMTLLMAVDYNNPAEPAQLGYIGFDEPITQAKPLSGSKFNLPTTGFENNALWSLFNSAASHVCFDGDMYAFCMGATTGGLPTAEIQAIIDYYKVKLNILPMPPVVSGPPTLSGIRRVGQTLTATPVTPTGVAPITNAYQWLADGTIINGATALTYTLTSGELGKVMTLRHRATNAGGTTEVISAATSAIQVAATPPTNTAMPTIPANPQAGANQVGTAGTWTGGTPPITYAQQWQIETAVGSGIYGDIAGATSVTYLPLSADVGKKLRLKETATNEAGSTVVFSTASNAITSAAALESETTALLARMATQPTETRKTHINAMIKSLKDNGIWAKLDSLYVMAGNDSQAGKLDWKVTSRSATETGSGNWNLSGYQGRGTVASVNQQDFLDTNYNSTTAGGVFTQNSAHEGVFVTGEALDTSSATNPDYGVDRAYISVRSGGGSLTGGFMNNTVNNYTTVSSVLASAVGHHVFTRSVSTGYDVYQNGSVRTSGFTAATATPTNGNHFINRRNGSTSCGSRRLAAVHSGSNLTATDLSNLYTALRGYLVNIGVTGI